MRCSDTGLPGVQQPGAPVSPSPDAPFDSRGCTTTRAETEAPHHAGTGGTVGQRECTRTTVPPVLDGRRQAELGLARLMDPFPAAWAQQERAPDLERAGLSDA